MTHIIPQLQQSKRAPVPEGNACLTFLSTNSLRQRISKVETRTAKVFPRKYHGKTCD
jgi:hypothetical protein